MSTYTTKAKLMKEFTAVELRRNTPEVYNEVQEQGKVKITHRDRPDMILIREDKMASVGRATISNHA